MSDPYGPRIPTRVADRAILVVDDESRIRQNLAMLLSGGRYRVETAPNGDSAVQLLRQRPFDLVITDIMMQAGSGFSLLEWVTEHSPNTLVTVITGFASMESTIKAMRMGAFDYLVKPFDFELLSISVERAMRRVEADRERARAISELELWSNQLRLVNRLGRKAASTLSEPELLNLVAQSLHTEFGYHHAYFAMLDESQDRLVIQAQAGAYDGIMPARHAYDLNTGITGRAVAEARRVLVGDVRGDKDYVELVTQTRSQVALPIVVEGKAIGALSIESGEADGFDRQDCTLLETLADMVASSIQTIRLYRKEKETKDYLEALIASSADAIVTTDNHGIVTFFSPGAEVIYGYSADEVVGQPVAKFYAEGAAEAERIMTLLRQHDRLQNHEAILLARDGRKIHASVSASLLVDRNGKNIGTLGVSKDVTQRVELERKLKELTITDGLTGLYNQRHFYKRVAAEIERARRQSRDLSLMLFDVDHFKEYNDSHGHLEGDKLLRQIGKIVQDAIRNLVDSGYRYGGDEFTVLLPDLAREQGLTVTRRIKHKIEGGAGVRISVGLVGYRPGMTGEEFIRLADEAMYDAKRKRDGEIVAR